MIVKKLGETIGYSVGTDMVRHCTRIAKLNRASNRPRTIVVQFNSQMVKDYFLASVMNFNRARSNDKLNSTHIGIAGNKDPIFVTEHLSPANKALHAAARLKAKELGYKFIWVRNGRIFLRKAEGTEQIYVRNMESLSGLH